MSKSLQDDYAEFCEEYKTSINKELKKAGLPPMSKLLSLTLPPPLSFEEYVEIQYRPLVPYAIMGAKFRESQAIRARQSRGKVSDDGITIRTVIERIALSPECCQLSSKELWPLFFAGLDAMNLDPKETGHPEDIAKAYYSYDFRESRKKITFGRFASVVSKVRASQEFKDIRSRHGGSEVQFVPNR